MRPKILLVMLVVGVALLWPVPVGGVLVLVTAALGLAIAWEAELTESSAAVPLTAEPPEQV